MTDLTIGKIEQLDTRTEPMRPASPILPTPDVDTLRYRRLRSMAPLKEAPEYLDLVRDFPCIVCGVEGSKEWPITAHHTTAGHHGGARADFSAVPMCPACHAQAEEPTAKGRELHTDLALVYLPLHLMRVMEQIYSAADGITIDLTGDK